MRMAKNEEHKNEELDEFIFLSVIFLSTFGSPTFDSPSPASAYFGALYFFAIARLRKEKRNKHFHEIRALAPGISRIAKSADEWE